LELDPPYLRGVYGVGLGIDPAFARESLMSLHCDNDQGQHMYTLAEIGWWRPTFMALLALVGLMVFLAIEEYLRWRSNRRERRVDEWTEAGGPGGREGGLEGAVVGQIAAARVAPMRAHRTDGGLRTHRHRSAVQGNGRGEARSRAASRVRP
jgi:hypothetical protein